MSYDDFCRLTLEEFGECSKAWYQNESDKEQREWERMRTLAVMTMQPHCRKKLNALTLLPFPWDRRPQKSRKKEPELTKEQRKARFERRMSQINQ